MRKLCLSTTPALDTTNAAIGASPSASAAPISLARSVCVCVLRWCNRVTGADLWLESLRIGGKGIKCGEEGWRRPAGLEFGMEASAFGLHRNG